MKDTEEKFVAIRGVDVVRAVSNLRSHGKITEKLTAKNYKKYTDLIGKSVYKDMLEFCDEHENIKPVSEQECIDRTSGLVRYLAVRNRLPE